jgi:hypothetical protein
LISDCIFHTSPAQLAVSSDPAAMTVGGCAIKHWEGARRTPESPARTLLTVIDKNPAAVPTALNPAAFAAAVGSSKPTTVHVKVGSASDQFLNP